MSRLLVLFLVSSILIPFSIAQFDDSDYTDVLHGPRDIEILIVNADPEHSQFDGSTSDEGDIHEERGLAAGYGDDHDDPLATEPHFNGFGDDVRGYGVVAGGDDPEAHFNDYDNARPVDRNDY